MTPSVWRPERQEALPVLHGDIHTEVCVVGAGIAGVCVAYELRRRGHDVVVLQDGRLVGSSGETERSTAHLVTALDRGYRRLSAVHGRELTRLAADSHATAISHAEALVARESIDCDFSRLDGFLVSDDPRALESEMAAACAAGVPVDWATTRPLPDGWTGRALCFPAQAQMDPVRFTAGLAGAALAAGARFFGQTRAAGLESGSDKVVVNTMRGSRVTCDDVVLATNAPIGSFLTLDAKQAAYRSYVVGLALERGALPHGLFWDTARPFHYVRACADPEGGGDLLLVGGGDHKTGQHGATAEERWVGLEAWARRRFPAAGSVKRRWSGQIMETIDGLAFIGTMQPGIHVVTGDCGNGITHGLIAGRLVPDLVEGFSNPLERVYDPYRVRLRALGEFVRETANVVAQQIGGWISGSDLRSEGAIPRDSGAVMRRGLAKVAVYRDPSGVLHERSAVCPHLGCVVGWNPAERSWDCPCHGSRFAPTGEVLHGPATRGLAAAHARPKRGDRRADDVRPRRTA
jgi:glycine/D-amino acid oxidase-like deaminating enzyme/nitrite reductase/ring-hydroxylating ferredoxin subunit